MKGLLIDTHILLWWLTGSKRLDAERIEILENPDNTLVVSTASLLEIYLKASLGKLKLPGNLEAVLDRLGVHVISMKFTHLQRLTELPFLHKDPFDRLLIAQAQVENLTLVSDDVLIRKYDVQIM